jgi:ubiquinone/menaquinone biosynthesis C-methylase UbiE
MPISGDFKQMMREQWDRAAHGWSDQTPAISAWLRSPTQRMFDMAHIERGQRVLDLAAGAGDQTADLALRLGPDGEVVATDLSPVILDRARERAMHDGLSNIRFEVADVEALNMPDESFDAAICRLGMMFLPKPVSGLSNVLRVLKPQGWFCAMVFSDPTHNPCMTTVMRTALEHAGMPPTDPYVPGTMFSLGKEGLLEGMFAEAGFRNIAHECVSAPFHMQSAHAFMGFIQAAASPIRTLLARLDQDGQRRAVQQMEERLEMFSTNDGWAGPNELLLVAGQR